MDGIFAYQLGEGAETFNVRLAAPTGGDAAAHTPLTGLGGSMPAAVPIPRFWLR